METKDDNSFALSTHVFAPNNSGFIRPLKTQFTHFKAAGNYDFFGLSCEALNETMFEFFKTFVLECKDVFADQIHEDGFLNIMKKIESTVSEIKKLLQSLKNRSIYSDSYSISRQVINTGHIPVMLKAIATASMYKIAARRVSPDDVSAFFQRFADAQAQGREYCVKTDMMSKIAELRSWVEQTRYTLNPNTPLFILCNKLIIDLDNKIIAENQKHLPAEYEQFDLYDTFVERVYDLTCQLDDTKSATKSLADQIIKAINNIGYLDKTVDAQQKLSNTLYDLLVTYLRVAIGLGNESEENVALTIEQDTMLQNVLPLIAYLNSPENPFARNGLFGKEITNDFHKAALEAYKEHESNEHAHRQYYNYYKKPSSNLEFNGDQIEQLLDGKELPQQETGFWNSLTFFCSGGSSLSQSAERREQLALPAPSEYTVLRLTYGSYNNDNGASFK